MNFGRLFLTSRCDAIPLLPLHYDFKYADGWTLVHQCVREGDNDTLLKLIELGADLDVEDRYGITPYDVAAQCGNYFAYKLFLDSFRDQIVNRDLRFLIENSYPKSTVFRSLDTLGTGKMSVKECTETILFLWLSAFYNPNTFTKFWEHLQHINYKLGSAGISNSRAGLHQVLYGDSYNSIQFLISRTAICSGNVNAVRTIAFTSNGVEMLRVDGLLPSTISHTSYDIVKYLFELGQPDFLSVLRYLAFPNITGDIRILDLVLAYSLYKPSEIGVRNCGKIPTLSISFLHSAIINGNYEMVKRIVMVCDVNVSCNNCCDVMGGGSHFVALGLCNRVLKDHRFFRLLMTAGACNEFVYREISHSSIHKDFVKPFYDDITLFELLEFQVQKIEYKEFLKTYLKN